MRVTDQRGRLGRVEFRNAETWQLVGSIWANAYRTEASGVFSIPADLREMVAEVLNDTGRVLARIAVDVGKFDTVVPLLVGGNFEPYYLEPVYCSHFGEQPGDVYGSASGHPYDPPGAKTYVSGGVGRSGTTVYQDFTNDNSATAEVLPPGAFWNLYRKKTIANTVNFGRFQGSRPAGDGAAGAGGEHGGGRGSHLVHCRLRRRCPIRRVVRGGVWVLPVR
ncbi:MAG: hypothetical protein KatS3mg022_2316 [Armatimonadota bacterium]|nr:MAG: hypothetical protein KatS3mg022_2316 [Armatimonadota bacterium]